MRIWRVLFFSNCKRQVTAFVEKTDDEALEYIAENFTEEDVEKIINYAENVVSEPVFYSLKRNEGITKTFKSPVSIGKYYKFFDTFLFTNFM